jgi:SOS response regulatory protein OraA/RecX
MSNYYSIKNRVKINAKKWKDKEIDNLLQKKKDMELMKLSKNIIEEYMEEEYKVINKTYEMKLLEEPTKKTVKKQKDKDLDNIITTKYYLVQKGYNKEYIDRYIEREYNEIERKYNKVKIDFID